MEIRILSVGGDAWREGQEEEEEIEEGWSGLPCIVAVRYQLERETCATVETVGEVGG